MKMTLLWASALALAVSSTAAASGRPRVHGKHVRSATDTRGATGSAAPSGRKLATDSVGKAVDMPNLITLRADELKWVDAPPALPRGAKMATLEGDPSVPNKHYAVRLRFPANYRVAPHYHPADERVTILSGTVDIGHGERWDAAQMKSFGPMTFYGFPAGMTHYVQNRGELVIQVSGVGPFDLVYINPADDPRRGTGGAGTGGAGTDQPVPRKR